MSDEFYKDFVKPVQEVLDDQDKEVRTHIQGNGVERVIDGAQDIVSEHGTQVTALVVTGAIAASTTGAAMAHEIGGRISGRADVALVSRSRTALSSLIMKRLGLGDTVSSEAEAEVEQYGGSLTKEVTAIEQDSGITTEAEDRGVSVEEQDQNLPVGFILRIPEPRTDTFNIRVPLGSNLSTIAARHGETLGQLLDVNPIYRLHPDYVQAGSELIVDGPAQQTQTTISTHSVPNVASRTVSETIVPKKVVQSRHSSTISKPNVLIAKTHNAIPETGAADAIQQAMHSISERIERTDLPMVGAKELHIGRQAEQGDAATEIHPLPLLPIHEIHPKAPEPQETTHTREVKPVIHIVTYGDIVGSALHNITADTKGLDGSLKSFLQHWHSGNEVYKPGECSSTGHIPGSTPQEIEIKYFVICDGLTLNEAAGIEGNLTQESSGYSTEVQNGGYSTDPRAAGAGGWGLAQWTPGAKAITEFHKYHIKGPVYNTNAQLELITKEMENVSPTGNVDIMKTIRTMDDPAEVAKLFEWQFEEGPVALTGGGQLSNRQAYASSYSSTYSGLKKYEHAKGHKQSNYSSTLAQKYGKF